MKKELWEYFIDKKFRVGDIIKINKKIDTYDNYFYNYKTGTYSPYFSGRMGRVMKIIDRTPEIMSCNVIGIDVMPINQIIAERLMTENKLYMVSMIMPLPKTKNSLVEVIGIMAGDEIILANEKEMEIYRPMEENYIAQLIAEKL